MATHEQYGLVRVKEEEPDDGSRLLLPPTARVVNYTLQPGQGPESGYYENRGNSIHEIVRGYVRPVGCADHQEISRILAEIPTLALKMSNAYQRHTERVFSVPYKEEGLIDCVRWKRYFAQAWPCVSSIAYPEPNVKIAVGTATAICVEGHEHYEWLCLFPHIGDILKRHKLDNSAYKRISQQEYVNILNQGALDTYNKTLVECRGMIEAVAVPKSAVAVLQAASGDTTELAVVPAGSSNDASAELAVVPAGSSNDASAELAVVPAGSSNDASAELAVVPAGSSNDASAAVTVADFQSMHTLMQQLVAGQQARESVFKEQQERLTRCVAGQQARESVFKEQLERLTRCIADGQQATIKAISESRAKITKNNDERIQALKSEFEKEKQRLLTDKNKAVEKAKQATEEAKKASETAIKTAKDFKTLVDNMKSEGNKRKRDDDLDPSIQKVVNRLHQRVVTREELDRKTPDRRTKGGLQDFVKISEVIEMFQKESLFNRLLQVKTINEIKENKKKKEQVQSIVRRAFPDHEAKYYEFENPKGGIFKALAIKGLVLL